MKQTINWGMIGLGKIAHKFAEGLTFVDNASLYGVASSNVERGKEFAKQHSATKTFGSYEELAKSDEVDVVYIASFNHQHYEHAKLCLENGKHVLCEKPLTTSSAQTRELFEIAQEKNLFFMEALWTRFMPSILYLEDLVAKKKYGEIKKIDVTFGFEADSNPEGRLLNKELGGGALLDIGIYPLFLVTLLLGEPEEIDSNVEIGDTGVDIHSEMEYKYPNAVATIQCSFREQLPNEAIIEFEQATVTLKSMWHCPTDIILTTDHEELVPINWVGNGYNYEAQFVSDVLLKGKTTQKLMPNSFTISLIEQIEQLLED